MPTQQQNARIPLQQLSDTLERNVSELDAARAAGLDQLATIRRVKAARLAKEQTRLAAKLGPNDPRLLAISVRLEAQAALIPALEMETARARTPAPDADPKAWIVHGYVRDQSGKGLAGLTVAFANKRGKPVEAFGFACTNSTGYFLLRQGTEAKDLEDVITDVVDEVLGHAEKKPLVFLRVLGPKSEVLFADPDGVTPAAGVVEYREITIGPGAPGCQPPKKGK